MKIVKGVFLILLFYFVGECVSYLIRGFIPGSILGMVFLFLSLHFKLVNPDNVSSVANVFTKNMAIFFIPAGAGLMANFGLLSKFWMSIIVICSVSTALVIAVVAIVEQKMEKKKEVEE
ncbi:CidA/LrgA family protein [Dysgonomonas sp. 520]|uniref:CidA/LrgA family protein n=1 Tax=Dysgonomonas sp. 520 TaxID=2302931 RepID=UPI0013CF884D|nr:CidA/LrgA family protein [Dysgonomonas sp. 520]NDW09898.1 CidA/LrgA family protein [Dysgonomonas sp. 520]